jgi:hypothetical protein
MYDIEMVEKLSDAELQNIATNYTEAAHIIPFSLAVFTEREVLYLCFPPTSIVLLTL